MLPTPIEHSRPRGRGRASSIAFGFGSQSPNNDFGRVESGVLLIVSMSMKPS